MRTNPQDFAAQGEGDALQIRATCRTEVEGIPYFRPSISAEDIGAVEASLRSGWLTRGEQSRLFEREFAAYVGAAHAISVSSCTAALTLALAVRGIGPGDVVIMPSLTFTATAEAVLAVGATPLLVDCDPDTLCLCPEAVEEGASSFTGKSDGSRLSRLAAVIPVHYGGRIADVQQLERVAGRYGLEIVHDAAHCLPGAYRTGAGEAWTPIGAAQGIACFSFYANKCITTGEGGMITTNDAALAEALQRRSLHGLTAGRYAGRSGFGWDYAVTDPGMKANMPDPLAALGRSQLRRADSMRDDRAAVARTYLARLGGMPTELPRTNPDRIDSWHIFALRLDLLRLRADRNVIFGELARHGVECSVHWRPLHLHPLYTDLLATGRVLMRPCPVTDAIWPRLLSLPIYPALGQEGANHVCEVLAGVFEELAR